MGQFVPYETVLLDGVKKFYWQPGEFHEIVPVLEERGIGLPLNKIEKFPDHIVKVKATCKYCKRPRELTSE